MTKDQDLLRFMGEFEGGSLHIDSKYLPEIKRQLLGKAKALSLHLQDLGYTDLSTKLDDAITGGDNLEILELIRGYVIPTTKVRLTQPESDARTEQFWSHLHPRVRSIASPRFHSGQFADAVEAAFKEVNSVVKAHYKEATGTELDGVSLMQQAFSPKKPTIPLVDQASGSGMGAQQGYMFLFAGSMMAFRNPAAHENLALERVRAIHCLYIASLLLTALDERPQP